MTSLVMAAALSTNAKIGLAVGAVAFVLLFFKLIAGFIRFCFRHPFIFILLLLCGGLGFIFNFLLVGVAILAVVGGGLAFFVLNEFNG